MTVVDDLVTRYRLENQQYLAATKQVSDATKHAGQSFDASSGRLSNMIGVAKAAGLAIGGVVATMTGLGIAAVNSAAKFDTYQRTFGAALGSAQAGIDTMAMLEDYATRSAFSLDGLTQAAKMLAAGGLEIGRFLPIVERFALVVSGVDPQGLEQVAGALLRAKGGGFGEAMEIFRRAGVGTPDIRAQGIGVSKGGEIQSSADQFLDAIDKISQGRLKTIADSISGGAENKLANVGDVVGQAFRQVGSSLLTRALPAIEAFTKGMKDLVDNGAITAFSNGMLELAGVFREEDITNNLREFGVTLRALPKIGKELKGFFEGRGLPDWMQAAQKGYLEGLDWLSGGKFVRAFFGQLTAPAFASAKLEDSAARGILGGAKLGGSAGGQLGVEDPAKALTDKIAESNDYLRNIDQTTQRQVNLLRGALGGGDLGALGVSQVDLSGMRRSGGAGMDPARLIQIAFGIYGMQSARVVQSGRMR